MAKTLEHDLKTLARFIGCYCSHSHANREKRPPKLPIDYLSLLGGENLLLCEDCHKLLAHAVVKRTHCPMNPKPMCKHCPNHCYHPMYREKIREVMRVSGKRLLLTGRIDYLLHMLF